MGAENEIVFPAPLEIVTVMLLPSDEPVTLAGFPGSGPSSYAWA